MSRAAAVRRFLNATTPRPAQNTIHVNCPVSAVAAGASLDGKAAVTVTVNGTDTIAPYLDSYLSPTVGDMVRVQVTDNAPLILGRVVGLPVV